ncbi:hypothetical protein LTR53_000005 [Teratosphaeriaceae sp. CCFEE 6253]|nr:hypothetical protein LTR53_000005 [Teratosphaeriaceae sp. CCFEE 6253]
MRFTRADAGGEQIYYRYALVKYQVGRQNQVVRSVPMRPYANDHLHGAARFSLNRKEGMIGVGPNGGDRYGAVVAASSDDRRKCLVGQHLPSDTFISEEPEYPEETDGVLQYLHDADIEDETLLRYPRSQRRNNSGCTSITR